MTSTYENTRANIRDKILSQHALVRFREAFSSQPVWIKTHFFDLVRQYLKNELEGNNGLTDTEKRVLTELVEYWEWNKYNHRGDEWWGAITEKYIYLNTLQEALSLW